MKTRYDWQIICMKLDCKDHLRLWDFHHLDLTPVILRLRELGLDGENPTDEDDPYNLVSYR